MPEPAVDSVHPFSILPSDGGSSSFPPLGSNVNALMVFPRFPPSFWGFEGVHEIIPEKAVTPPLGLITIAALCPARWNIRLIDRAVEELSDEDLRWADLVMVSAMHAQRVDAVAVLARARSLGRRTFIGVHGPALNRTCYFLKRITCWPERLKMFSLISPPRWSRARRAVCTVSRISPI